MYNIAAADLCMSFNMLVQMVFFIWPALSSSEQLCMCRMELMTFFTTVSLISGFFATIDRFMIIVVNRQVSGRFSGMKESPRLQCLPLQTLLAFFRSWTNKLTVEIDLPFRVLW